MDTSSAATTDWAMALANSGEGACWDAAVVAASVTAWASWSAEVSCVSMPTSDVGLLLRVVLPLPYPDIFHCFCLFVFDFCLFVCLFLTFFDAERPIF